ncbi:MAG: TnpV protein, partial [Oscillospiraceae bacterium]|nr:TnpV protein [Oscillospiraceae bacterium]
MNLTYTKNGDYLIPDLSLTEQENRPLGKYGR